MLAFRRLGQTPRRAIPAPATRSIFAGPWAGDRSSTRRPPAPTPKKVVYLWGAGATQADALFLGARSINLLMRDSEQLGEGVATRILKQLPKKWRSSFSTDKGTDIEKLISLLAASSLV